MKIWHVGDIYIHTDILHRLTNIVRLMYVWVLLDNIIFSIITSVRRVLGHSPSHPDLLGGCWRLHRWGKAQAAEVCHQLLQTSTAGLQGEDLPDLNFPLVSPCTCCRLYTTCFLHYWQVFQAQPKGVFPLNGLVMKIPRLITSLKMIIFKLGGDKTKAVWRGLISTSTVVL